MRLRWVVAGLISVVALAAVVASLVAVNGSGHSGHSGHSGGTGGSGGAVLVSGWFEAVGGAVRQGDCGIACTTLSGTISIVPVNPWGPAIRVRSLHGRWQARLDPGRYVITGTTTRYTGPSSSTDIVVAPGHRLHDVRVLFERL